MTPRPPSAVTRRIYVGSIAAIALIATLSFFIYRSAVDDAVAQSAHHQLATVRTAAVGIQAELESVSAQLRQFSSLPSVQNLDVQYLGQRVAAAFAGTANDRIRFVVRVDPNGRLFVWSLSGQLIVNGAPAHQDEALWSWGRDRKHALQVRVLTSWDRSTPTERALVIPIWRDSPSAQLPDPPRDFNGVLALVIDLDLLMRAYLDPARREMASNALVIGLATPGFGLRLGPDESAPTITHGDAHEHDADHGSELLDDDGSRRVHAWAKFNVADEKWMIASSASYWVMSGPIRQPAMAQLGLTAMLLIAVPIVSWLILKRERVLQGEQRDLERRLAESQKMEAIGKLAGGVAQDFNNMLTAILGYASMIQEDAPQRSAIRDQANQIRRAAERAGSLTQKLLAFSRRQVLQADPLDFRSMLGNLLPLVRKAVGEDIEVSTESGEDLWLIMADAGQLEQSILNLALNARDAMPNGGTLQIDSRNAPRPQGERRHDTDVKPGDYVQITVTDTGVGMDDATRTRMFEPFFTTKAPGKGTGLGLSTIYGFVRQCGGFISVLSTPGGGTSIELLLPRAKTETTTPLTPVVASTPARQTIETILLAEDEDGVRELALATLERRGYYVLSAPSGEDAIKVASTYDGTIHLLVSDVVMPGMKGPELAQRLRAMRPGIKVLFVSGYAADVVTSNDLREASLLSKPFSPAALSAAVRSILDVPLSSPADSQQ